MVFWLVALDASIRKKEMHFQMLDNNFRESLCVHIECLETLNIWRYVF
jgi:hypothetical protein